MYLVLVNATDRSIVLNDMLLRKIIQPPKKLSLHSSDSYLLNTEEDGWKIKNIYIEKKCSFSLNLMVKIDKKCFKNV